MPARRPQRPVPRQRVDAATVTTPDGGVGRAISDVSIALRQLESRVKDRSGMIVDLIIGDNNVVHGLGRKPTGVTVSATVASAAFAYAMVSKDQKNAVITVLGTAQPGAGVEFW